MTDTMTSQNIDLSFWDILYMRVCINTCALVFVNYLIVY
jgi:hypothetical protein